MASKLAIVLAASLALTGIARAQGVPGGIGGAVPDEPKPEEPKPEEPKPEEPKPEEPKPEEPKPEEPKPEEAAKPEEPAKPEAKPAEETKRTRRAAGFDRVELGFGLGIAGATGAPAEIYPASYGAQVAFGLGRGPFEIEARIALGYGALPKQEALRGENTRASLSLHSVIFRAKLPIDPVAVGVFAGIASGDVPVLVAGADVDHPDQVGPMSIEGVGPTFGGSVHWRFSKHGELLAELAVYDFAWELPGHGYVVHSMATDPMTTTSMTSTDDISSTPWQFTVAVHAIIGD